MSLYHGTGNPLPIGTVLEPGRAGHYQREVYAAEGVYLTDALDNAYFYAVFGAFSSADFSADPQVYEVEAEGARDIGGQYLAPSATVVRNVTSLAKAAFRQNWERVWKPTILSSPNTKMPTPAMIVAEFEQRMKTAAKEAAMTEQQTEQPTGEAAEAVRFGIVDCSDPKKALEQLLTLDSDKDGVPNYRDKAPFDPKVSSLTCDGCGEQYDAQQIEGSLHDHWTAAAPGDLSVRASYGLTSEAATYRPRGNPKKPVNSWDRDVMHSVTKDGGFTFRDVVGDGPKEGYMVSVNKDTEVKMPLRDLTSAHVADYMSTHQQTLKDPNNYLGGWVYKGNVYLDISRHTPDREEALRLARANKQLGIYDIGKGETVLTADHPEQQQPQRAAFVTTRTAGVDDFVNALRAEAGLDPLPSNRPATAIEKAALRVVRDGDTA